jgi:hypothetical protein
MKPYLDGLGVQKDGKSFLSCRVSLRLTRLNESDDKQRQ